MHKCNKKMEIFVTESSILDYENSVETSDELVSLV